MADFKASVDFYPVNMRTAVVRAAPIWIVWAPRTLAFTIGALSVPLEGYSALSSREQVNAITAAAPAWLGLAELASSAWLILEAAVLLANRKRRTLHDFIAGTVVVRRPRSRPDPGTHSTTGGELSASSR